MWRFTALSIIFFISVSTVTTEAENLQEVKEAAPENSTCPKNCEYKRQESPKEAFCYCPDGNDFTTDNQICDDVNECANLLYFAQENAIFSIDSFGENIKNIVNTTGVSGFDYHYIKNTLYWSDVKNKTIYSQLLDQNSTAEEFISLPVNWSAVAIAVDWIGNNLYVVDSVDLKIDIFDLESKWHAIVLSKNLTNPTDIALDPTIGYMFIADGSRILRASMDGTNLIATIFENIKKPSGITVDIIANRIYWCDSVLNLIETADYFGQNRIVVVRGAEVQNPSGIALFANRVYWTDSTPRVVKYVDKFNNTNINSVYNTTEISDFKAIKAYHSLKQASVDNPCGSNNGGCQHMCVLTNSNSNSSLRFRCVCGIGWKLASDERTCELVTDFLLYSQKTRIAGKIVEPMKDDFDEAILPIVYKESIITALDVDAQNQQIFYLDFQNHKINRININGTQQTVLYSEVEGVEGIAFDWVSKYLYYVSNSNGTLNVVSTLNFVKKTLLKNLKEPRGIVVHPKRGYVFFSELEDKVAHISRILTDGSNLTVFKDLSLVWPNGLAIDYGTGRLYWCDAFLKHIQHSTLDGTDVKTIKSQLIRHPFGIAIQNEFIYATDWAFNNIIKLHKVTGEPGTVLEQEPDSRKFYGVKIFSKDAQPIIPNYPCKDDNGGCEAFCYAIPAGDNGTLIAKCGCQDNRYLNSKQGTCRFEVCAYSWEFSCDEDKCIHNKYKCDGIQDCEDNTDEEGCRRCMINQFECKYGDCIPMRYRCDNKWDCIDGSDEAQCENATCEFQCKNGDCIFLSWKCDSEKDCKDGSDEGDFCDETTCPNGYFQCESRRCIRKEWVCDGNYDCLNHEDEKDCPTKPINH